jgi:protein TonB
MPALPPPPPPPPPAAGPKPAQQSKPLPTPGQAASPVQAPIEIPVETGLQTGVEGGVPGGIKGGIPEGVLGGVVGGIITDVPLLPPPPPPPAPKTPVRVGGKILAPELIHRVEPVYPSPAAQAHVTGLVILEATVNEQGEVTKVVVLRSHKLLEQAAIDAVKQWKYRPLLLNGSAQSFVLTVMLNFSIG